LTLPGFGSATASGGCCDVELGGGGGPLLVGKGRESELPAWLWLGGVTWENRVSRRNTVRKSSIATPEQRGCSRVVPSLALARKEREQ